MSPFAPAPNREGAAQQTVTPRHDGTGDLAGVSAGPVTSEAEQAASRAGLDTTAVLPYAKSRASSRTSWLRAWMMTAPIDVAALLTPLLLTQNYWRGTLANAALTVAIFAAGGLYRARRHVSILDELPSLCGRLLASASVVAIIAAERHSSVEYVGGFIRGVALSAVLVIVGRAASRAFTILVRKRRWAEHNAIIIGNGPIVSNSPGCCAATPSTASGSSAASTPGRVRAPGRSP
jgi:hypothetical protein